MITSFFKSKRTRQDAETDENEHDKNHQDGAAGSGTKDISNSEAAANKKRIKTIGNISPEAMQLISCLNDDRDEIEGGGDGRARSFWRGALDRHFSTPSFARLASFVDSQRKSKANIFPPVEDTFTALNWTPLEQVRVVIVGQDPYHGPRQAHGLCFSVHRGVPIPPSLRNVYKELLQDPAVESFTSMPAHGYLERWARQGVLMINTVLTVRQGEANSHKNKGWEEVTDEMIRAVDRASQQRKQGVVFLLWGSPATKKAKTALGTTGPSRHTIIATSHPSPLGATKTDSPFLGSKCFSRANQALREMGCEEIDWSVDGAL